ncbi:MULTISPECIES: STAS domain-containing protein [Thermomonospora]|uniref:Anti-sigma factor antagonist n=1 Tax=Thermomonospora curvata (strain ATCC 19995 / DSM 43183 / JCM 3096 / KCTC 9072 / NBRC 15933 / NCIMB 10081 / Henssen B9) TaxID=471852 RepID=D1A526_THECD|nr:MULTISPECIES: STAS domain-containing protein [Thermomonospora]ACY98195.1 anti-sigma-factor antagonist [Thermomonospora curvata DSM 43183]PKK13964.1 MAG: anti-sigma factor antagonist [Thermomonospora sp. CIF 1]
MGLALHTTRHDDRVTVTVRGSIDLHSSDELRERLKSLVEAGHRQIVVDLAAVDFCDSSGLNVLVRTYKQAREQGGVLTVTGAYGRVENVLRTTGLDRFLIGTPPEG